jgi:hypothetical protein
LARFMLACISAHVGERRIALPSKTSFWPLIAVVSALFVFGALSGGANAQIATDFYGQATLLPDGGQPGPTGSVQFYRVGDPTGSTRVVVEVDGLQPGTKTGANILSGDCQGNLLFGLNDLVADKSGHAEATTVLSGQQVVFGQWYVRVGDWCDQLNPGQVCYVCGKVNEIIPLSGGTGAPGMPATGADDSGDRAITAFILMGAVITTFVGLALGGLGRRSGRLNR